MTRDSVVPLADGVQKKRRTRQNGVQAIFTPQDDRKWKASFITGLFALGAGAIIWIGPIQSIAGMGIGIGQLNALSSQPLLILVALPLVTGGAGLCTYLLVVRRTRQEYFRIESALYKLEALVGSNEGTPELASAVGPAPRLNGLEASRFRVSKGGALALFEGVVLVVLYAGLSLEYKSNAYMQDWVRANIPFGSYFFDWVSAVFLVEVIVGVFVVQWVLRKSRKLPGPE